MAVKSKTTDLKEGLGVALCDEKDNLLFKTKGLLHDPENMTYMEDGIRTRRRFYPRQAKKEACLICFDDNIDSDLMFSVDNCGHRFCLNCIKQHIEVKLLDGTMPNCPHHRCKTQLSVDTCDKLLTNKLVLMWKERIKENSTPFNERIYCPYQRCSYLMSKTELSTSDEYGLRICFKCSGSFCVHCKVPWHSMLSCTSYRKLHSFSFLDDDAKLKSLANSNKWRQCGKCQHMVERSSGCPHIKCRCGYVFCYDCGAEWDSSNHRRDCASWYNHDMAVFFNVICCVLLLVAFLYILYVILVKNISLEVL